MRHVGEYSPAKTGEYPRIFPNFQNCARCIKDLKDTKDNSLHLGRKYARIFVLGLSIRYSEQIMSADKYPRIFSRQMEAIVYLYNNQITARALIGQSAMVYCASKPMEKSRGLRIII